MKFHAKESVAILLIAQVAGSSSATAAFVQMQAFCNARRM
jgi:hypothetical protein